MKFYQENKINPLAGCLPLLVQMPIFLALFRVMREPVQAHPEGLDLYAAFCTTSNGVLARQGVQRRRRLGLPNPQYFLGMDLSAERDRCRPAASSTRSPTSSSSGSCIITAFAQSRQSRRNAAEHDVADGDDQHGAADRLRPLLAPVPRRPGALLPDQQPLAARPAGADHAQDHRAHQGPGAHRGEGRRETEGCDRRRGAPPAAPKAAGGCGSCSSPPRHRRSRRSRTATSPSPAGTGSRRSRPRPNARKTTAKPAAKPAASTSRAAKPTTASSATTRKQNSQQAAARRKSNKRRKRR